MAIPQAKSLSDRSCSGQSSVNPGGSLERSHRVVDSVEDSTVLPAVEVFNDYVAVLLTPRKSTIALPGNSEFSNVGVILGFGPECKNAWRLGQNVVINPKGGAIVVVEEQGPEFEGKVVNLYQERNVFYGAKTGPSVNVVPCSDCTCVSNEGCTN